MSQQTITPAILPDAAPLESKSSTAKKSEAKTSTVHFENIDLFLDLGNHIAYYRRKRGYTQKVLAQRVGISASYLSKIESENQTISFSVNTFFSICRELAVEPEKMFKPLP